MYLLETYPHYDLLLVKTVGTTEPLYTKSSIPKKMYEPFPHLDAHLKSQIQQRHNDFVLRRVVEPKPAMIPLEDIERRVRVKEKPSQPTAIRMFDRPAFEEQDPKMKERMFKCIL